MKFSPKEESFVKDYHFEKDENHLDQTIRLDEINEKIKELKKNDIEDELGDANAFLDAFESEKFEPQEPETPTPPEAPKAPEALEDGLNKRTIGLLALVAVAACILGFSLVRCGFHPAPDADPQADLLLVEGIVDADEAVVYDIFRDARKTILFTDETQLLSAADAANGNAEVGDLFLAELAQDGKTVLSADYASNVIQKKEISGLAVDTKEKLLTGEEASFPYGEQAIFLYHGEKIQPAEIMEMDRLLLKGYGDTVWAVEVLEYHGYLAVENGENIKNGTLQIDEEEPIELAGIKRIPISTGSHSITVAGDNIETRKDTVSIREGEELKYDLSKAQEKMGVLLIEANVSEYRLYVNGAQMESPAVLPVGEYDLVILKNGYMEWNDHVELTGDTLTVKAELEKEFQYGTLTITADQDGAAVFINGEASGIAPMQVNLPYGSYAVRVEKDGYAPFEQTVQMNTATALLHAELE